MPDLATNLLHYGDNLDILRRYLPDASVDVVYLDPPVNSSRDYNVIFRDESGNATDAQLLDLEGSSC
jgi:DNA modification methylase